ncbi:hypothetical protein [Sodalis glossinidius]|nr:hypothetical protein [Sodalis glossinidius]
MQIDVIRQQGAVPLLGQRLLRDAGKLGREGAAKKIGILRY